MKRIRLTSLAWLFSCQRTTCDKKSADSLTRQTWKIETCQKLVKTFYLTITWCLEFLSSGHFLVTAPPTWPSAYAYQSIRSAPRVYRLIYWLSSAAARFFVDFGNLLHAIIIHAITMVVPSAFRLILSSSNVTVATCGAMAHRPDDTITLARQLLAGYPIYVNRSFHPYCRG